MDQARAVQEFAVFDLPFMMWDGGTPLFGAMDAPTTAIKDAVIAAHIETEGEVGVSGWLNTDLNAAAAGETLAGLVTSEQWTAYISLQKAAIDQLRLANRRLQNGVNDAVIIKFLDAANVAVADLSAEKNAWAAVKALFPYPTDYSKQWGH